MANDEAKVPRFTPEWAEAAARISRDIAAAPPLGGRFVPPVPKRIKPAEDAFETLEAELGAFEARLDDEHEIAIRIFGGASLIHVHTIRFDPPDILLFEGFTPEGDETLAIQHVAQLNLQLVKAPKLKETAFRVGFVLPPE